MTVSNIRHKDFRPPPPPPPPSVVRNAQTAPIEMGWTGERWLINYPLNSKTKSIAFFGISE